jgi:hypothetical protein
MTDGILLIATFNPTMHFEIFNKEVSIEDVYLIVTDHKNQILHFSESCMKSFGLKHDLINAQFNINKLFPNIEDD